MRIIAFILTAAVAASLLSCSPREGRLSHDKKESPEDAFSSWCTSIEKKDYKGYTFREVNPVAKEAFISEYDSYFFEVVSVKTSGDVHSSAIDKQESRSISFKLKKVSRKNGRQMGILIGNARLDRYVKEGKPAHWKMHNRSFIELPMEGE